MKGPPPPEGAPKEIHAMRLIREIVAALSEAEVGLLAGLRPPGAGFFHALFD
jgi:hypothetical protein